MSCSDDDLPLVARARGPIAGHESDSDDDVPLSARVPSVTTTKPKPKNRNKSGGISSQISGNPLILKTTAVETMNPSEA